MSRLPTFSLSSANMGNQSNKQQSVSGKDLYSGVNNIIGMCTQAGSFLAGTSSYDGFYIQVKQAEWCY